MEKFISGNLSATIHYTVNYCVLGESKKTAVDYATKSLDIEREKICLDPLNYLTRLKITNTSNTMVKLFSAYPIITDDFSIGEIPSKDWQILNGARQLNDIPASCTLGVKDASYAEAVNRLTEEGVSQRNYMESDSVLSGDLITVIKAGKQYVSLEILTCENMLNDISISADFRGDLKGIRIGGEFNCLMEDGDVIYTDWVRICTGGNFIRLIEDYASTRKAMCVNTTACDQKPSIYTIKNDFSNEHIAESLAFLRGVRAPFDYIVLGLGWTDKIGNWEEGEGVNLSNIASQINKSGYKAGLTTAPFLIDKDSDFCVNNRKLLLRHADGSACTYMVYGKEYFVLDVSSEETLEHLEMTYQRLSAYGIYMHNIDFLSAFIVQKDVVLLDPTQSSVMAYTKAVNTIKKAIGIEGCLCISNGFNPSLCGIGDCVQVVSSMDIITDKTKSNVIPKLINQIAYRGYMSQWWHNSCGVNIDGDFLKKYSLPEVKNLLVCEYLAGGVPNVSDISSNDELKLLKCLVPYVNIRVYPREAFDESAFIKVVDAEINNDYHTVCFFNNSFTDVDLIFKLDNKACGGYVDHLSKYNISSYFGRIKHKNCKYDDIVKMGTIPANSCEIVKIAKSNKPQVILSDMHFSMGGEVEITFQNNMVSVAGDNKFNCKGTYVVALPDGVFLPDGKDEFSFTVNGQGPFRYDKMI